ncbi:putative inorganic phosphate transporter 1-7-like [Hibiscus syriacus]|uniref:Inorganic phosphate transporter 1-7-like n=1 Tax=Hibiscus syriacus TaxID=106335 RepID=A0A6A3AHF5_HIBSY|nr:putative inorganic phosphate transporter 1-7-like [Hibiscus syriacus]
MDHNGQRGPSTPSAMLASLLSRRAKHQEEHRNIERQVYDMETSYLQDPGQCGNVLKGFEGSKRSQKFQPEDRLFYYLQSSPAAEEIAAARDGEPVICRFINKLLFFMFIVCYPSSLVDRKSDCCPEGKPKRGRGREAKRMRHPGEPDFDYDDDPDVTLNVSGSGVGYGQGRISTLEPLFRLPRVYTGLQHILIWLESRLIGLIWYLVSLPSFNLSLIPIDDIPTPLLVVLSLHPNEILTFGSFVFVGDSPRSSDGSGLESYYLTMLVTEKNGGGVKLDDSFVVKSGQSVCEVGIVYSPFVVKLKSNRPFVVKLNLCCLESKSFVVKLKLALKLGNCLLTTSRPFVVKLNLCCLESNIIRCEVEIGSEIEKLFVDNQRSLRHEVELALSGVQYPSIGPFVMKLNLRCLESNILRCEVEIGSELLTTNGPFVVKLSLDLNILRREVEIQISFVVKLKSTLEQIVLFREKLSQGRQHLFQEKLSQGRQNLAKEITLQFLKSTPTLENTLFSREDYKFANLQENLKGGIGTLGGESVPSEHSGNLGAKTIQGGIGPLWGGIGSL